MVRVYQILLTSKTTQSIFKKNVQAGSSSLDFFIFILFGLLFKRQLQFLRIYHRIAMKNRGKQNYQHTNGHVFVASNFERGLQQPISPIKRHTQGDSFTTNVFENFAKSTSEINYPLTNIQNYHPQSQTAFDRQRMQKSQQLSPESDSFWKNKYLQSQKNYETLVRKYESRTKQMYNMQQTIQNQTNTMRQMQDQINRLNGLLARSQRTQCWNNTFSSQSDPNKNGINRFYVEELQRSIDNLQRQNQRLSSIIMRKVKNCFE